MNIRNCKRCKKIYQYDGFNLCHNCRREDEEDFLKVKEYLDENPGANITSVVEDTKVDTKKVIEFLKAGRLEIQGGGGEVILQCEKCGVGINTGRFCKSCMSDLSSEVSKLVDSARSNKEDLSPSKNEKFRVIERRRK